MSTQPPNFTFPDDDLALDLINLYFANINLYLPLLHRPTFEKSVAKGLHHTDERFACTYLLVCAIGARYSDDPRVLLDGVESLHSCGWKWFSQVQMVKKSLLAAPTLYDLQFYCVRHLFFFPLRDSCGRDGIYSFPLIFCKDHLHHNRVGQWWELEYVWPRMLERIGGRSINLLRQQRMSSGNGASGMSSLAHLFPTLNKARRVLVCMDRMISAAMGRPCAIHDDEYAWFLYIFTSYQNLPSL